jgi:hypothetical protein
MCWWPTADRPRPRPRATAARPRGARAWGHPRRQPGAALERLDLPERRFAFPVGCQNCVMCSELLRLGLRGRRRAACSSLADWPAEGPEGVRPPWTSDVLDGPWRAASRARRRRSKVMTRFWHPTGTRNKSSTPRRNAGAGNKPWIKPAMTSAKRAHRGADQAAGSLAAGRRPRHLPAGDAPANPRYHQRHRAVSGGELADLGQRIPQQDRSAPPLAEHAA